MRKKKYQINLTENQRIELEAIRSNGQNSAKKIRRAAIVLLLDESQGRKREQREVANLCGVSLNTIYHVSKRFFEEGLQATLERKERQAPTRATKITGETEARVIALSCSEPPPGRSRWTLQLLADKAVELHIFDSVSDDTIHKILKKQRSSHT